MCGGGGQGGAADADGLGGFGEGQLAGCSKSGWYVLLAPACVACSRSATTSKPASRQHRAKQRRLRPPPRGVCEDEFYGPLLI